MMIMIMIIIIITVFSAYRDLLIQTILVYSHPQYSSN